MNRLIQDYKLGNGFFVVVKLNQHLGDEDIDTKIKNTLAKAMRQYGNLQLANN